MSRPAKPKLPQSFGFREFGEQLLGKTFYPKQAAVLEALYRGGDPVSFICNNEGGKALALDTPIPTPSGWSTMGAVQVGDVLYSPDGKECRVTLATPVMVGHDCYRVTFSDGSEIVADADHLWEVDYCEPSRGKAHSDCTSRQVVTTDQIRDAIGRGVRHSIPTCRELDHTLIPYRLIVSVEPVASVPVKCIQVDSPDHCFLVSRSFIKTHNTREIITTAILAAITLTDAKVITTSGSYAQIKDQLDPSLKAFAGRFPQFDFQDCAIRTGDPNSFWHGISTNDPGKMEGHHDEKNQAGQVIRPLLIIVDEAKTVKDPIYEAIERCKPTWLLLASSAGYSQGEFFRSQTVRAKYYQRIKQTADECPHIRAVDKLKLREKWGPEHPLVKSMLDAEFMPFVEGAVVNLAALDDLLADPPPFMPGARKYFCDFAWSESGTGDQNVCAKREGNRITVPLKFRAKGLHAVCARFVAFFISEGCKPWEIEGDADGDGANIIKQLRQMGWAIGSAHNGGAPRWNDHYANLASEMWCEMAMSIIKREFILPDDLEFYGQALNRKIVPNNRGKMCIESKLSMKDPNREGGAVPESPDVCDAVAGCISPLPLSTSRQVMNTGEGVASTKDSVWSERPVYVEEQPIPGAHWG